MEAIHAAFARTKLDYKLDSQLFFGKQERGTPMESFVAQKSAIVAQMARRFTEDHQISTIYGMLALSIRQ